MLLPCKNPMPRDVYNRPIMQYQRLSLNDVLQQAIEELRSPYGDLLGFRLESDFFNYVFEEAIYAMVAHKDRNGSTPKPRFEVTRPLERRGYARAKAFDAITAVLAAVEEPVPEADLPTVSPNSTRNSTD